MWHDPVVDVNMIASSHNDAPENGGCDAAHAKSAQLQALRDALIEGEQSGLTDYDYERFIAALDFDDWRARI